MKEMLVPIDKAGRVVLPKDVREELAINPGDLLKVSVHGDQLTLRPNRIRAGFIKQGHGLVFTTGETDLLENEVVENIRQQEHDRVSVEISKGLMPSKRR